jgi:NTE family protein
MALVLAGGGLLGIAWELGVMRGLRLGGIDPADADLVVGTSAGSVAGAILGSGLPMSDDLMPEATTLGRELERFQAAVDPTVAATIFERWQGAAGALDQAARAEIGALATQVTTVPEREYVDLFTRFLPLAEWPRPLTITAVDVDDGAFVAWNASSRVPLVQAVAASCALPGVFPPVTVGGRRYVDGGLRSGISADLAEGYDPVVVAVPIGGEAALDYLGRETAGIRALGARVVEIVADERSALEMGPDLMDASRMTAAVTAGERQGAATAAGWSGASARAASA